MADYLILDTSQANNSSRVVVHSTIPAGNNAVGNTWQSVLAAMQGGLVQSAVPASLMPPGRQAELDSGAVYEWVFQAEYDANATPANKQAVVEAQIAAREATELSRLQNTLRFWGFTGSI